MCEFGAQLAERLFRDSAFRHVLNRRDVLQLTIIITGRMGDCMQILYRMVRHHKAILPFKVVAALACLFDPHLVKGHSLRSDAGTDSIEWSGTAKHTTLD